MALKVGSRIKQIGPKGIRYEVVGVFNTNDGYNIVQSLQLLGEDNSKVNITLFSYNKLSEFNLELDATAEVLYGHT